MILTTSLPAGWFFFGRAWRVSQLDVIEHGYPADFEASRSDRSIDRGIGGGKFGVDHVASGRIPIGTDGDGVSGVDGNIGVGGATLAGDRPHRDADVVVVALVGLPKLYHLNS